MISSRANEKIPKLIRRLGSRSAGRVDEARARLSVLGARAVEDLIETLEGGPTVVRARVMPLLALIQDPRAQAPLTAMLLDRSPRLREIAAGCLARFPARETASALVRILRQERGVRVRVAAVQALVEQYAAGRDEAVGHVLEVLTDQKQPSDVRLAACSLLSHLGRRERKSLLAGLAKDADEVVRTRARELEDGRSSSNPQQTTPERLDALLADLGSDDYGVWNESIHQLVAQGAPVVTALLEEMRNRGRDHEYCARAGMVLRAMGPRRCRAVSEALEEVDEPVPLMVLVEVAGSLCHKPLIYRLGDLIQRLADRKRQSSSPDEPHPIARVRARAHLELARIGSRVAVADLRDTLDDRTQRVEIDLLAAVRLIGKKEEIGVLLKAWLREDDFMREWIGETVRAIMKRERIRRNNRYLQALGAGQRRALDRILGPPHRRRLSSRPAAASRPTP